MSRREDHGGEWPHRCHAVWNGRIRRARFKLYWAKPQGSKGMHGLTSKMPPMMDQYHIN